MAGKTRRAALVVSADERKRLERLRDSRKARKREVERARILLYMALELSHKTWRLVFSDGQGKERHVSIEARVRLGEEIERAKEKLGLQEAGLRSCYEAGRDGFGCTVTW